MNIESFLNSFLLHQDDIPHNLFCSAAYASQYAALAEAEFNSKNFARFLSFVEHLARTTHLYIL